MKSLFIFWTTLLSLSLFAQSETNMHTIHTERTDLFCSSGFDLDSCAYIPLYNEFYEWLGTPYKYAGMSKKGIDCSGLIKQIYREVYHISLRGSARDIYGHCTPVAKKDLKEGDLIFFKINKSRISHIAIYLQDGYFVHASVSRGVMINNIDESYYKKYYFSGGRLDFPGVINKE